MMADCHSKEVRRKNMAAVKGKDTKPEMIVRSLLHRGGFRFRLHDKSLPGKPDLVLKKYNAVIFVHGCFWHMHGCKKSKFPADNQSFWREKLESNKRRDEEHIVRLSGLGLRVMVIRECHLSGKEKLPAAEIFETIKVWLLSDEIYMEI